MCDGYDLGKRVCFGHQIASILFVVLILGGCDVARDRGIEYTASIKEIGPDPTHKAPDDFNVWELEDINAGEVAQFQLPPQTIGGAIQHKTVSEIWFVTAGNGRVWEVQPIDSDPPFLFDLAAITAVKQWRYPSSTGSDPRYLILRMNFKLE